MAKRIDNSINSSSEDHVHIHYQSMTTCPEENEADPFLNSGNLDLVIAREMWRHKIKNLCTCSGFCQYSRRRMLSGKAVMLILVLIFFEKLAFYAAIGNILSPFLVQFSGISSAERALIVSIIHNIVAPLMFPVAGWLGEAWIGRYRAIHIGLWLLWLGYSSLAIVFSFDYGTIASEKDTWSFYRDNCILPICFIIISIGSAGFEANVIPFGADQIIYKASEELSSYFYWYYWVRNLGAIMIFLSFTCSNFDAQDHIVIFASFAALSITLAISLNAVFKNWLFLDPEKRSPLVTMVKVLFRALVARRPMRRSAFSFSGSDPPPRIDLAKIRHGGKFTNEEVEDVKTFIRILLVLLTIGGALTVYAAITSVIAAQDNHMQGGRLFMNFSLGILKQCSTTGSSLWLTNVVSILVIIPLLDKLVFPCLREYTPNMLKRIGIGYFLSILSPLVLLVIEGVGHHQSGLSMNATHQCMFKETDVPADPLELSSAWVVLPHLFITLTEIFTFISSLEFVYAQTPYSMRGMMIGMFFFTQGLFSTLAAILLFIFSVEDISPQLSHSQSCAFWFYLILLGVAIVSFVFYIGVAIWYKNRERGDTEDSRPFYRQL